MFEELVLASNNRGKLAELSGILGDQVGRITPQGDLGVPEAEETGTTFEDNALLKARHAAQHTGLPALADDSGLAVDFLDGAPGVFSARYAGPDADDEANNRKLLKALDGVPESKRSAAFHCVIVLVRDALDHEPIICRGVWHGRILDAPRGSGGFGYDPLFLDPQLGKTGGELTPAQKAAVSHRGQALRCLLEQLKAGG